MYVFKRKIIGCIIIKINVDGGMPAVQRQILYPAVDNGGVCGSGGGKRAACHGAIGEQFGVKAAAVIRASGFPCCMFFCHDASPLLKF